MTTEELIISAVRILGALLILRWMLVGSILAVVVDLSDLFLMNLLDMGGVGNYQALDKWLDLTYMATFLWVSLRWEQPYRRIAVLLFAYRIIGVLIFEVIGNRWTQRLAVYMRVGITSYPLTLSFSCELTGRRYD